MLFVIKSLFFLFVHSVSQANADTLNNALYHTLERKRIKKKKIKLMVVSSVGVKCGTIGLTFNGGNRRDNLGNMYQMCDPAAKFYKV